MKIAYKIVTIIGLIIFSASFFCYFVARWYILVYGDLGFDAIISTLLADVRGVESGLVIDLLLKTIFPTIISTLLSALIIFGKPKKELRIYCRNKSRIVLYPFKRGFAFLLMTIMSVVLFFCAAKKVRLIEYLDYLSQQSTIFEFEYIDPVQVRIQFPKEKQNMIFIFLESMESSFFGEEEGGGLSKNVIPELYELAKNNVNFSDNDKVGGMRALTGGTWTIGAMVSYTAGVPLKTPLDVEGNDYGQDNFLPGIINLTDILHDNGYYQVLMVGSDASFGGRKQYYLQHGANCVYDLYSAKEDGIVDEDYYVWWGMEDKYLFEYAKEKLSSISQQDAPFAFTMLTVDTHHVGGYLCELCTNDFSEQYENVIACSSRQVGEFVNWIKKQDFYNNTTIIICGDHPSMDNEFATNNIMEGYSRKVYNCIINSRVDRLDYTNNREFCTMDMFPTTLAALGCQIEGERLGLGTNLFSGVQTLCEKYGVDVFNANISKSSDYYSNHFY